MKDHLKNLTERYAQLVSVRNDISDAYNILEKTFCNGGTLFACGNGGSASDSEHIVGELMKGFKLKRPLTDSDKSEIMQKLGSDGQMLADKLQYGLKAISLTGHPALSTAFSNDVEPELVFAQQLSVLGKKGDVLIGISTSGNSKNVYRAMQVARLKGISTILMTGEKPGKCLELADCAIKVPASETYLIQEYHLPVYHTLCIMIEEKFYGERG